MEDGKKFDLARALVDIYGKDYTPSQPRMASLIEINEMTAADFLIGSAEAEAFENGNYVGLHRSTLRKVDVIANVLERTATRKLKTSAGWFDQHGSLEALAEWATKKPLITLLVLGFSVWSGCQKVVSLAKGETVRALVSFVLQAFGVG